MAGNAPQKLAAQMDISPSTLEKHLAALRQKLAVETTRDLIASIRGQMTDQELDAFHCWWPATLPTASEDPLLAQKYQAATHLKGKLEILRDSLSHLGVLHIYYTFVPLSVQGFMRGDSIDCFLAPAELQDAFYAAGGLMAQPISLQLFNRPADIGFFDLAPESTGQESPNIRKFFDICFETGCRFQVGLGFPAGGGFVGVSMLLSDAVSNLTQKAIAAYEAELRTKCNMLHAFALSHGTLAAQYGLTIRERDGLSLIASGHLSQQAAEKMKISHRALGKLLASARKKLRANTTAEAVYKAAAVNALVFL